MNHTAFAFCFVNIAEQVIENAVRIRSNCHYRILLCNKSGRFRLGLDLYSWTRRSTAEFFRSAPAAYCVVLFFIEKHFLFDRKLQQIVLLAQNI